jgi:RDD family
MLRRGGRTRGTLWPAAGSAAPSGYLGVVAKKSRNRGSAGPARATAAAEQAGPRPAGAGQAGTAQAGTAQAGTAQAGTAQLTAPAADAAADYPGKRFGLPRQGPGSVASMGRRVLALLIDWLLCMAIAVWLTHSQYWTIVVFVIEVYVLTALSGTTVGKRLCGIRVIRTDGSRVGFRWALVRTVLLLTVVLPLLTDYDRQGVHDRAADTIVVRL